MNNFRGAGRQGSELGFGATPLRRGGNYLQRAEIPTPPRPIPTHRIQDAPSNTIRAHDYGIYMFFMTIDISFKLFFVATIYCYALSVSFIEK